jgi:hypothetical protein
VAAKPAVEGRAVVPQDAAGERPGGAVAHRLVVVPKQQEKARSPRRSDARNAAEGAGRLGGGQARDPLEVSPSGDDVARQPGDPFRAVAEGGEFPEPPCREPGERGGGWKRAQGRASRTAPPQGRESVDRARRGRSRVVAPGEYLDGVLEDRRASQHVSEPEPCDRAEHGVAGTGTVKLREIDVEGEGVADPRGQRRQHLDLAGVLPGHLQHGTAGCRADTQQVHGAVGQLLGAFEDWPRPIVPSKRGQ